MSLNKASIEAEIKAKVVEIAAQTGDDASELGLDEIIPATGLIDSTGLLELIAWYETVSYTHLDVYKRQILHWYHTVECCLLPKRRPGFWKRTRN